MSFVSSEKRKRLYPTGSDHPRWSGGARVKDCEYCGKPFVPKGTVATFRKTRFCSRECGWKGQIYLRGVEHPNYNPNSRKRTRPYKQHSWANAVISRDGGKCRNCGASGVELHAHHVESYMDNPSKRWDVDNGITLCHKCHWDEHSALDANAVNSGNTPTDNAGGNPEPSFGRKLIEGVTTSGRAYRRWEGKCDWCGKFISKRWSDAKGKKHLFCGSHCMGKHRAAHKTPEQRRKQAESLKRTLALKRQRQ